jgi:O-antigen ligase
LVALVVVDPRTVLYSLAQRNAFVAAVSARYIVPPEEDLSYRSRVNEMKAIDEQLRASPILGSGMGASYVFFDPSLGKYMRTTFVDSGIGYLLLKFGLLGTAVFGVWAFVFVRRAIQICSRRPSTDAYAVLTILVFYLAFLLFGPSFFQFLGSWWAGAAVGYIFVLSSLTPHREAPTGERFLANRAAALRTRPLGQGGLK